MKKIFGLKFNLATVILTSLMITFPILASPSVHITLPDGIYVSAPIKDGMIIAMRTSDYSFGAFDVSGELVIPFSTGAPIEGFSEGLAPAPHLTNNTIAYMDKTGKVVIDTKIAADEVWMIYSFSEGYVCIQKGDQYGVMDKEGTLVQSFQYDKEVTPFKQGVALTSKNKLFGLINVDGEAVVPFTYQYAATLQDGYMMTNDTNYRYLLETYPHGVIWSALVFDQCDIYDRKSVV